MLGILYEKIGEYDKALEHHQQAVSKSQEQGVHIGATVGLANVGLAYLKMGDTDKALDYCLRSLDSGKNIANREVIAITLLTLGNVYLKMGDNTKACETLRKSLREIEETQAKPTELKIHDALASLYEATGELDKALEHHKRFHQLKDEIFNDESTTNVKNLQIRVNVETAEKEAEIQRLRYVKLAGMQAQLVQSEKMAALGSLVAGISHEVNTPIGVISNNAGLSRQALDLMQQALEKEGLIDRLENNRAWTRALDILNTSARTTVVASERISNLVTSLKQFSHLDEAELQMADVTEGIESTLMLLRPQLAPGVDIKRELAELPKIESYASELNQCFMTLLVNASDAIDGEGSITIKTSAGDDDVYIEISDTGRGIPAEKLANPFEIAFSQKDSRMRMRVGLSNTYNIIKKHGGDIKVASQVGEGTTFHIRLPIRQKGRSEPVAG
jgi:signal transduction histidine kinase